MLPNNCVSSPAACDGFIMLLSQPMLSVRVVLLFRYQKQHRVASTWALEASWSEVLVFHQYQSLPCLITGNVLWCHAMRWQTFQQQKIYHVAVKIYDHEYSSVIKFSFVVRSSCVAAIPTIIVLSFRQEELPAAVLPHIRIRLPVQGMRVQNECWALSMSCWI